MSLIALDGPNRQPAETRMHRTVAREIALAIARGDIAPGLSLPNDRVLSDRYAASRTVVREAIQHLALRRVLEVRAGSGTYVSALRRWDLQDPVLVDILDVADALGPMLRDLLDIRRMIEAEAAALAAERAETSQVDRLKDTLHRMLELRGDPEAYVALHGLFHRQIIEASGNFLLIAFEKQIEALQRVVLKRYFARRGISTERDPKLEKHDNPHIALVLCIEEGRPERARAQMLAHTQSLERIAHSLYSDVAPVSSGQ